MPVLPSPAGNFTSIVQQFTVPGRNAKPYPLVYIDCYLRSLPQRGNTYTLPWANGIITLYRVIAPKMYIGASASLQSMQYADSAAAEAAENALRQLAETGAVPAAWAAEALDTAETGESYTDWDGKYYSLDATYCVTDSLGFVTVRRFGMTDNALFTRYSVTMDSRTGTVVEVCLSMAGTDAENTPLPTETALRSFAAQAGLESLGDWAAPADSPYGCALYSTNGGALITASTHPYTYQDYVGTAPVSSDRWYYSLTLQLRTEDQLPG